MKKLFSTIICVFVFSGILFVSKSRAQAGPQFGIRGGLNIATLYNADFETDPHIGFIGGFYFNHPFSNSPFSLQPELLYSEKGFMRKTYSISYVEMPLLARYNFSSKSGLIPHIYAGPYIGFKVNEDFPPQTIPNIGLSANTDSNDINQGDTNTTDIGITIGGGVDVGRVTIGLRYEAGLTEAFDDDDLHEKNSVFSVTAGIGF